jgi:Carbohydrate binding module (family 35)
VIINAVVAEEPDGYRGRRRRLLVSRKGGGVVLPSLLVAASVVVVLIVVGVSQLLPRDTNGQIPLGGRTPNGAATDNGQPNSDDGSAPGSPAGSAAPGRSGGAKPSASPSGGVSAAPGIPAPPGAPPPAPLPTQTTGSPPAPLTPVSVEAERATLGGRAAASACTGCSGGSKVRNVGANAGWVTVTVPNVPRAGTYQMTITYELGQPSRTFYISVGGGTGTPVTVKSNVTDWSTPLTATIPIALAAGTNTVKFYNPTTDYAPDLDKVAVK